MEEMKPLGSLSSNIYKALAQPAVQNFGTALGDVMNMITLPVSTVSKIVGYNLHKAARKLGELPPEEIVPAKPRVAIPIIQKMMYTEEEEIVEAFSELLKNSCSRENQSKVLPAYSTIIENLTSDEVKILDFVYGSKNYYEVATKDLDLTQYQEDFLRLNNQGNIPELASYPIDWIPLIEVRLLKEVDIFNIIEKHFSDVKDKLAIQNPDNFGIYIENLQSLGVMEIPGDNKGGIKAIYSYVENLMKTKYAGKNIQGMHRVAIITSLGRALLEVCTKSTGPHSSNNES